MHLPSVQLLKKPNRNNLTCSGKVTQQRLLTTGMRQLYLDGGEDQVSLADRAANPTREYISRLHIEWRNKELGADNGKSMFDRLQAEIEAYNVMYEKMGGKAKLQ